MQDFEKLGVFYLGRTEKGPLLYESKHLVTHGVCVGMTGSGKTGLCLGLLEEAAIDGIPALVIDPKGDLGNLLLAFPQLRAEDFEPWVSEEEARKRGLGRAEFAAQQAAAWRDGLAKWGQDGARIERMKSAADFAIYTPGSTAGLPVSVLKSFAAPPAALRQNREAVRERVNAAATALLALMGIEADPIKSREHILIAKLLDDAWGKGEELDLGKLIHQIQSPPIARIGVMEMDAFFPAADRFSLAVALNSLLASPGFEAWLEGEALEVGSLLYTPEGKPRVSIFSIAHLNDTERMFFVTLLLNQTLSWMRTQPGTTSLRAIVYMDEIFGYFPPVANPPSKQPLLTLLKQARAFGLGVVLATQNPVDLDYKGLANCGTWFIGRLQTERDKARVMEGLEGAAAAASGPVDKAVMEQLLASLASRHFLVNNVHTGTPEIFESRWALSYLCGPLTRAQIETLMAARRPAPAAVAAGVPPIHPEPAAAPAQARPMLPPDIAQYFLPARGAAPGAAVLYEPALIGAAQVRFTDAKTKTDLVRDVAVLVPIAEDVVVVRWDQTREASVAIGDLEREPLEPAAFATLPGPAAKPKSYSAWSKEFATWIYSTQKIERLRSPSTKLVSEPDELERDFRIRLAQAGREERDAAVEKLRQKYAPKRLTLEERIRRARQAVEKETQEAGQEKVQTALSIGATLLGAFLGRKALSQTTLSRAGTAARSVGRAARQAGDVDRARETLAALEQQLADLDLEIEAALAGLQCRSDPSAEELERISIAPKKTNIAVRLLALAWAPRLP